MFWKLWTQENERRKLPAIAYESEMRTFVPCANNKRHNKKDSGTEKSIISIFSIALFSPSSPARVKNERAALQRLYDKKLFIAMCLCRATFLLKTVWFESQSGCVRMRRRNEICADFIDDSDLKRSCRRREAFTFDERCDNLTQIASSGHQSRSYQCWNN